MFYSHEVLTSRRYGVATVWLVATLGPKSGLRKVNRKQILKVDVPKACEAFIAPEAPMALRLTSNLLYGVSRVYQQQCSYVLIDAQVMQNNIRALLKRARRADLDMEGSRTRPETLLLEDDPTFLPELNLANLNFDSDLLPADLAGIGASQGSSLLSPHTSQGSLRSGGGLQGPHHLVIPSSDTVDVGDIGGFQVASDRASLQGVTEVLSAAHDGFLPDADFTFDAEGNMVDLQDNSIFGGPVLPPQGGSALQRLNTSDMPLPLIDQPIDIGIDDAFSLERQPEEYTEHNIATIESPARSPDHHTTTSVVIAPISKKRVNKMLPMDKDTQLPNQTLRDWNEHYVQNMADATLSRRQHQMPFLAKRNAQYMILDAGLGGVGHGIGLGSFASPLDLFCGERLYRALVEQPTSLKRTHDDMSNDESDPARRVRARSEELARGDALVHGQDFSFSDMEDMPPEVAREAVAPLDDFSSMPWNVLPSVRGSSVGAGHAGSIAGSAGRPSSLTGPAASLGALPLSRRGSRMPTMSPLIGHAQQSRAMSDGMASGRSESAFGDVGIDTALDFDADDSFQIFGPSAGVASQTADGSQWQRAVLDAESNNFMSFIQHAIAQIAHQNDTDAGTIRFEELLDPHTNSRIVAAQGLLHILSLATRHLLAVEQDTSYGDMVLRFPQPVAAL